MYVVGKVWWRPKLRICNDRVVVAQQCHAMLCYPPVCKKAALAR